MTVALALALVACGDGTSADDGGAAPMDAATGPDAGDLDAGARDAGPGSDADGGLDDAGAGDAGADDAGAPDGGGCDVCLTKPYEFGRVGGLTPMRRRSFLEVCRDFAHTRTSLGGGTTERCENEVPACDAMDRVSMEDLVAALADPDVVAAFAAAPVTYGRDTRPLDGQVFEIVEDGGAAVAVGSACRPGGSSCTPIPAGVAALRDLLMQLETERLMEPDCTTVFPGG